MIKMSEKAMVSRSFQVFWWNIPYIGIKFEKEFTRFNLIFFSL